MIEYPSELDIIFDKFNKFNIRPIIVGGYVRDKILKITSKDIDIELYGLTSYEKIENILQEFGSVNSVGKSFSVCKLKYNDLHLDFSLPRKDSKISSGHKGFKIDADANLDFKTAASRRDFTINALGYDVISKKILDPFEGRKDLADKILKAVDLKKFSDDPLRVLRAIVFSVRFELSLEKKLFAQCKKMIEKGMLEELAKERIFDEIQKLLLKSKKPSRGFLLLKKMNGFLYFKEFATLKEEEFHNLLQALDTIKIANIPIMLAILIHKFSPLESHSFLHRLTNKKDLLKEVLTLVESQNMINLDNFTEYEVSLLATKVNIENFAKFLNAITFLKKEKQIKLLLETAKKLHVLNTKASAILQGRDIMKFGITPSKKYSLILKKAYDSQLKGLFSNYQEGLIWLKKSINSF